jgi:carboxyl-terminal processing protease
VSQLLVAQTVKTSKHFEISKNLEIFTDLYKEIQTTYVNDIDPGELMKTGIDAMLESLDPYTVFIPESEMEDVKLLTSGEYGGIGAVVICDSVSCYIEEPYFDKPAYKAGLRAGDELLEVNGVSTIGMNITQLGEMLKGQAGTQVNIKYKTYSGKINEVKIVRDNIKLDAIPYTGILKNKYAYIRFTSFFRNSAQEFERSFQHLKAENPDMKALIIDLRENGGGLLREAVEITNLFVPKDEKVVEIKGRKDRNDRTYVTTKEPLDINIPLVILVDNNSASASEILAGAFQDLDRGVIIGERTFGKGLVQNVLPLSYNSQLKVTVSKYYIPSGRCIQEIDYGHKDKNGESHKMNDSTKQLFYSKNGRAFFNNGGIQPDIKVERNEASDLVMALKRNRLFFKFALKYHSQHDSIDGADVFELEENVFEDFLAFLKEKDFQYKTKEEKDVDRLEKDLKMQGDTTLAKSIEHLRKQLEKRKQQKFLDEKKDILLLLRTEIITQYYFQRGKAVSQLKDDEFIEKAFEILADMKAYQAILQPGKN